MAKHEIVCEIFPGTQRKQQATEEQKNADELCKDTGHQPETSREEEFSRQIVTGGDATMAMDRARQKSSPFVYLVHRTSTRYIAHLSI